MKNQIKLAIITFYIISQTACQTPSFDTCNQAFYEFMQSSEPKPNLFLRDHLSDCLEFPMFIGRIVQFMSDPNAAATVDNFACKNDFRITPGVQQTLIRAGELHILGYKTILSNLCHSNLNDYEKTQQCNSVKEMLKNVEKFVTAVKKTKTK